MSVATLPERLSASLGQGHSVAAACAQVGISPQLGEIIVEDLVRRGVLTPAGSLCSSGLGACAGSGQLSDQARLHCAACPLALS